MRNVKVKGMKGMGLLQGTKNNDYLGGIVVQVAADPELFVNKEGDARAKSALAGVLYNLGMADRRQAEARNSISQRTNKLLSLIEVSKAKDEIYPSSQIDVLNTEEPPVVGTNSTIVVASHFFKSLFSPTILVMPAAFKNGGLIFGIFGHVLLVILIGYNIGRLVVCADHLSKREKLVIKTYDQVAYVSFEKCSDTTRPYAKLFRHLVNVMFAVTTIDALTIFIIFIARNMNSIVSYYFPEIGFQVRHFIFFQMALIMLTNTIRQLKYLSPFSIVASIILYGACICCFQFYLVQDSPSVWERRQIGDYTIIRFISMVLFSQSGISIALTLKSSMKKPHQFLSFPGVFCVTLILTTLIYIPFGYFGYLKFGDETKASIMLNLPNDESKAIIVKSLTIMSVFMTIPIGFYVAFNVIWNNFIKPMVSSANQLAAEYLLRAVLAFVLFVFATALPTLGPMIVLKGALFHSHLEVIYPPIVEYAAFYPEKGMGKAYCRLIKTIIIASIGIIFCIGGVCIGIFDLYDGFDELI